jgi:hypothetical protein
MLDYSEFTIMKNTDGLPTALGIPIKSIFLQNDVSGLIGGGGKKKKGSAKGAALSNPNPFSQGITEVEYENLAIPAGLVCTTETVCRTPAETHRLIVDDDADMEIVPDGLYDSLLDLLDSTAPPSKKMTRRNIRKGKSMSNKSMSTSKKNVGKKTKRNRKL